MYLGQKQDLFKTGFKIKVQECPNKNEIQTGCYEKHLCKDCKNGNITWQQYINKFAIENPEIPVEFNGELYDLIVKPRVNTNKLALCLFKLYNSDSDDNNVTKQEKEGVIRINLL